MGHECVRGWICESFWSWMGDEQLGEHEPGSERGRGVDVGVEPDAELGLGTAGRRGRVGGRGRDGDESCADCMGRRRRGKSESECGGQRGLCRVEQPESAGERVESVIDRVPASCTEFGECE